MVTLGTDLVNTNFTFAQYLVHLHDFELRDLHTMLRKMI